MPAVAEVARTYKTLPMHAAGDEFCCAMQYAYDYEQELAAAKLAATKGPKGGDLERNQQEGETPAFVSPDSGIKAMLDAHSSSRNALPFTPFQMISTVHVNASACKRLHRVSGSFCI